MPRGGRPYRKKNGRMLAKRRPKRQPLSNNRQRLARITRPITMRPVSAVQKVVYMNTFVCKPGLSSTNTQQTFSLSLLMNSPWLFSAVYNNGSTGTNQSITANEAIVPLDGSHAPTATSTIMPGVAEGGGKPFEKYQQQSSDTC